MLTLSDAAGGLLGQRYRKKFIKLKKIYFFEKIYFYKMGAKKIFS